MRPLFFVILTFLFTNHYVTAQIAPTGFKTVARGFMENKGQLTDQNGRPNTAVKYILPLARGMNLQMKANSFSYDVYIVSDSSGGRKMQHPSRGAFDTKPVKTPFQFQRVDVLLKGANLSPRIVTADTLLYSSTFYNLQTGSGIPVRVRSFGKICYQNIYPFIDLVFDCNTDASSGTVEYYFIVRPGGNPLNIQMQFNGADRTQLKENRVEVSVQHGKWQERIPESYLDSGISITSLRSARARPVRVRYEQRAQNTYGFRLDGYDRTRTLVIDPTPDLIWGTYLGENLNDWGFCVTTDADGNVFMGGASDNPIHIATSGAYKTVLDGYGDAILSKWTSDGQPLWITYYGGSNEDVINGIAVDHQNNIIAVGYTFSYNNIATPGSYKPTKVSYNGATDAFVAKFTGDGNLAWATYYGGDSVTWSSGVAIDNNNNIYIAAWTNCTTGISTPGAYQTAYGTGWGLDMGDGCTARFSPNGAMVWSTYYGGSAADRFYGISIDQAQNLYLSGSTSSTEHIATGGSFQSSYGGGNGDAFLVRFNLDGVRQWATYCGGSNQDYATCVCTDQANNIYIGGLTFSMNGISSAGMQPFGGSDRDGFIGKFSPTGQRIWGTFTGGNGQEDLDAIGSDVQNNIYVTGYTISTAGIATPGAYQTVGGVGNYWTTYLLKYNSAGSKQWGTYYGANGPYGEGEGFGMAVSGDFIYLTGETSNTEKIATCDAYQKAWNNNQDAFLAKFGTVLPPTIHIDADNEQTFCAGKTVHFTATAKNVDNQAIYQWYWNGQPVGADDPAYSSNQLSELDSIRCVVQKNSSCTLAAYSSNSIVVHIDPALPAAIFITGPENEICKGEKAAFTALPVNAGNHPSFQWKVNGVNTGTNSSGLETTSLQDGDLVTCTVTNHGSCTIDSIALSNAIRVAVKKVILPTLTITSSVNPVCAGDPVLFSAEVLNVPNNIHYEWEVNGLPAGTDESTFSSETLQNNDQILCKLIADIAGCSPDPIFSNDLLLSVKATPQISITGDSVITKGSSTRLIATATGNDISYSWTPETYLDNPETADPVAMPTVSTSYSLHVANAGGCSADKIFKIIVLTKITIPNAFTPNGDAHNDLFRPLYGSDISQIVLTIYSRWGQIVFEDRGTHQGWDGTMGGQPQPSGTYVYEFRYKNIEGKTQTMSGSFLLIR